MTPTPHKKVLIIGTNMMNIYHHRLELIEALLSTGYEVIVAAPRGGEEKDLEKLGCRFIHMPVDNRGTSVKNDLGLIRNLAKIYKEEKPDVVLTFYTKTNIYGGIVAGWLKLPYIENVCGLGTSLSGKGMVSKIMKFLYTEALKKCSLVFFQNKHNIKFFTEENIYNGAYTLLPGSGVSLNRYKLLPYPIGNKIEFLFCSRILKEKGIDEYLSAAKEIKKKYPETIFHVAGPCDPSYKEIIEKAAEEGTIVYHGKIRELHPLMTKISCSILPSYYPEGTANILLESAASGRPIITTSLPGCGETVEDSITGFVVKEKNVQSLVEAIEKFIHISPSAKEKMGREGRRKMEQEFNRDIVINQYLKSIKDLVS